MQRNGSACMGLPFPLQKIEYSIRGLKEWRQNGRKKAPENGFILALH